MNKGSIIIFLILLVSISGCLNNKESEDAIVKMYVSNQSNYDDPINITVYFDDQIVFNETCWVENSHNWIEVEINTSIGKHDLIVVENDNGVRNETQVNIRSDRWIVINYWYTPISGNELVKRDLEIDVYDQQVNFM